ncbi:alkylmercury lyase [Streptomyces sp. Agncl-13]|uniref:alkylmercury lyase n=1 Tax=Streptomyces sp. Agncl-13 TaxID=3400628 RepID=UPI003A8737EE
MRITVLTVPDCPNAPLVRERIEQALDGRAAKMAFVEVADEARAARLSMTGSPTVLIDGTDPFTTSETAVSVSCRLYRSPGGRTEGAPSVADLQRALDVAEAGEDCDCPPMDATGRGGRGRIAPATGGLRDVQ